MRYARTLGLPLSIIVCSQNKYTPLMWAARRGRTDIIIALLKAKADINAKTDVRFGLAGWMVVCVQRLSTLWG